MRNRKLTNPDVGNGANCVRSFGYLEGAPRVIAYRALGFAQRIDLGDRRP